MLLSKQALVTKTNILEKNCSNVSSTELIENEQNGLFPKQIIYHSLLNTTYWINKCYYKNKLWLWKQKILKKIVAMSLPLS